MGLSCTGVRVEVRSTIEKKNWSRVNFTALKFVKYTTH